MLLDFNAQKEITVPNMNGGDAEEPLAPGVCHYCPRGSEHSIINTGDTDLVLYTVVQEL